MGEVYAAYHPDLDRRIALKVVNEAGADESERRARLLREARAIARLSHPNVVAVHDTGTLGDRVFIAMEFVDGQTVDEWLRAAPRSWQQVLDVFVAAGRGLAAAHAADIIHRDFKPQNVMIDKDGSVRVMDFGLARLVNEDAGVARDVAQEDRPEPTGSVTKTGALLGTPAYMSPEQFRGGAIDARSDQFSFCVAVREALVEPPAWLRAVVMRGAAADRDERYRSLDQLLEALARGRNRLRRRASAFVAALAVAVVAAGGWRLARGEKFACAVPKDRIAAAWPVDDAGHPRRKAIHAAFLASGRPGADTSWHRLAATLDEYARAWNAMYMQTCEATHVRGEQSGEVLDLRMSCLNDNLDQIRALTDTLMSADAAVVSRAASAAAGLTPVARCADVALLKSAVPLPRDERKLREVQRLRQSLADVQALWEVGNERASLAKAIALRPEVEATGYKPLLAQLLVRTGIAQIDLAGEEAEETLEGAFFIAAATHDDGTAANAAAQLIGAVGLEPARSRDAERWARLANALLDRPGNDDARVRAWVRQNHGIALATAGELERAAALFEQAASLKERSVGKEHPDVAISLDGLAWALISLDRPAEALSAANRAVAIHAAHTSQDGLMLANALSNQGRVLLALGRKSEARAAFETALRTVDGPYRGADRALAETVAGLGELELAEEQPKTAIPLLEKALVMYERYHWGTTPLASASRFALARALWEAGGNRRRARALAVQARDAYASNQRTQRAREVETWLGSHRR